MRIRLFKSLFIVLLSTGLGYSQTSSRGFNYQGYAVDPDGKALSGQSITVTFKIYDGTGTYTYEEVHSVTPDGFGVFHAMIGTGNTTSNKNIDFEDLNFYTNWKLQVIVQASPSPPVTISDDFLAAVPYARHAANGVPVGTIVPWGGNDVNNIPDGWLLCDGRSFPQSTYPQLYNAIGTAWGGSGTSFNLPDLSGRFLRGVDMAEGVDPDASSRSALHGGNTGDAVGTYQSDDFKSHDHRGTTDTTGAHSHSLKYDGNVNGIGSGGSTGDQALADGTDNHLDTFKGGKIQSAGNHHHKIFSSGGLETRPKNAAVYYIIKY